MACASGAHALVAEHFCSAAEKQQYCPGAFSCSYSDDPSSAKCGCANDNLEYIHGMEGCFCGDGKYGTLTCNTCPSGGTSSAGNNNAITNCYIRAGTGGSDSTGTWEYAQNCYYSN